MKILISGRENTGLTAGIARACIIDDFTFCSRDNGYDLTKGKDQEKFAELACEHDVVIINAALWKFQQTVLLDEVYKKLLDKRHRAHIIAIGSTTDRVKNGKAWRYNAEKKALRDYSNTLAIGGVWGTTPKVTYISFGTLDNNADKHPNRKTLTIYEAGEYVKWVIDQPRHLNINEISIDPMQSEYWQ